MKMRLVRSSIWAFLPLALSIGSPPAESQQRLPNPKSSIADRAHVAFGELHPILRGALSRQNEIREAIGKVEVAGYALRQMQRLAELFDKALAEIEKDRANGPVFTIDGKSFDFAHELVRLEARFGADRCENMPMRYLTDPTLTPQLQQVISSLVGRLERLLHGRRIFCRQVDELVANVQRRAGKLKASAPRMQVADLVPSPKSFAVSPLRETRTVLVTANVRTAPTQESERVGRLVARETVTVTGRVDGRNWYRVRLSRGTIGYVFGNLLGKENAKSGVAGPIATELFDAVNPPGSPVTEKIIQDIPVKRIGRPEDIANAVSFFLSDASGYVTGQTLYVCGGLSVGAVPV